MLRIFHNAMIAYFFVIFTGGVMVGCGYKTKPYYERGDKQPQIDKQDSQPTPQNIRSIHSTSLSEDEGD